MNKFEWLAMNKFDLDAGAGGGWSQSCLELELTSHSASWSSCLNSRTFTDGISLRRISVPHREVNPNNHNKHQTTKTQTNEQTNKQTNKQKNPPTNQPTNQPKQNKQTYKQT